jgi:small subunit ribosomal protein S21
MGKPKVTVTVRNGDINKALKIFKRLVFDSGHIQELRERKEYTKPKVVRRKQKQKAVREQELRTLTEKIESGDTSIKLYTKKSKKPKLKK